LGTRLSTGDKIDFNDAAKRLRRAAAMALPVVWLGAIDRSNTRWFQNFRETLPEP